MSFLFPETEMQSHMYTSFCTQTDTLAQHTRAHTLYIKCAASMVNRNSITEHSESCRKQTVFEVREYRWIKNQYKDCSLGTLGNVLETLTLLL